MCEASTVLLKQQMCKAVDFIFTFSLFTYTGLQLFLTKLFKQWVCRKIRKHRMRFSKLKARMVCILTKTNYMTFPLTKQPDIWLITIIVNHFFTFVSCDMMVSLSSKRNGVLLHKWIWYPSAALAWMRSTWRLRAKDKAFSKQAHIIQVQWTSVNTL